MTLRARLRGRTIQVLRPSKNGTGPRRWQNLIRIPVRARRRDLVPVPGKCSTGVEYQWKARGKRYRVRIHDEDPSVKPTPAIPLPNALVGWVVRVSRGREFADGEGVFHPRRKVRPRSPDFDEFIANATHIPIVPPTAYP